MKKFLRRLYHDNFELKLLVSSVSIFIILAIWDFTAYKTPTPAFITSPIIIKILTNDGFGKIIEGLLSGLISAYIFYLAIDFLPREKIKQDNIKALNRLLTYILDAYGTEERPILASVFLHESHIPLSNVRFFNIDWLNGEIEKLRKSQTDMSTAYRLKIAAECANSRMDVFQSIMPVAVAISPEHAIRWSELKFKLALLSEDLDSFYQGKTPEEAGEKFMAELVPNLRIRMIRFLEEVILWCYLLNKNNHN